jgi:protein-S-isoprenylcysteine O-methyltransferase Ste14
MMGQSIAAGTGPGNNAGTMKPHRKRSFAARGGWWVAAQMPLLAAALAIPPWTRAAAGAFDHPLQLAGCLLVSAGVALIVAGLAALGDALTPFPFPRDDGHLETRGVYRLVRHPIYAGLIVGTLGWALAWLSAAGAFYTVAVALFFDRKAAREERWLRTRYPAYGAHARRARRFLPGVY